MNLANLLTVLRLCLVPAVVVAIGQGRWGTAFVLFAVAGLTDAVDGFVAKTFDQRTELGAILDPLADKALLVSIYVALAVAERLPNWIAVLVVSRDVMIVGAVIVSWGLANPVAIRPLLLSKANTAVQIAFAGLVLAALAWGPPVAGRLDVAAVTGPWTDAGLALVAALTVLSMGAYLTGWLRHMAR